MKEFAVVTIQHLDSFGKESQDCRVKLEDRFLQVFRSSGISVGIENLIDGAPVNKTGSLLKSNQDCVCIFKLAQAHLRSAVRNFTKI